MKEMSVTFLGITYTKSIITRKKWKVILVQCGKCFTNTSNLKVHKINNHGKYSAKLFLGNECGKSFSNQELLGKMMKSGFSTESQWNSKKFQDLPNIVTLYA